METTARELASAKRNLAKKFDRWADEVAALLKWAKEQPPASKKVPYKGDVVWVGESAKKFLTELQPIKKQVDSIPASFRQTAKNLRKSANALDEEGHRNATI